MKRIRVDFLIVGAGLAGSVTGFLLKKAGADVLALELLDAKTKDKLCGGMLFETTPVQFAQVFGEGCMDTMPGVKESGRRMFFTLYPANVWTITAWNGICKWAECCRTGRRYAG